VDFLKEEFVENPAHRREVRRRGEALHFILSYVKSLEAADLSEAMASAQRAGTLGFPSVTDWKALEEDVRCLVHEPQLKPFFDTGTREVFCELEVVDAFGEAKRIDRLIVGNDSIDLIDYKSSQDGRDDHHAQVKKYVQLVGELYPGRRVRGWLIYLNDRSLEAVG